MEQFELSLFSRGGNHGEFVIGLHPTRSPRASLGVPLPQERPGHIGEMLTQLRLVQMPWAAGKHNIAVDTAHDINESHLENKVFKQCDPH